MVSENLRLALDLKLKEIEVENSNLGTARSAISTLLGLGVALQVVFASAHFGGDGDAGITGAVFVALASTIAFVLWGAWLLRLKPKLVPWPEATSIMSLTERSAGDALRRIVIEIDEKLPKTRDAVSRLQNGTAFLALLLVLSVGAWTWSVQTTQAIPTQVTSPGTTTVAGMSPATAVQTMASQTTSTTVPEPSNTQRLPSTSATQTTERSLATTGSQMSTTP